MSARSLASLSSLASSANQKGTFNTKTIKRTTSSSSTSHDPNGNYLGLVRWMVGWLVVGSNDAAAAAFTLSQMEVLQGAP